ncbi:hypothetical protein IC582_024647 [Cucumis melo]
MRHSQGIARRHDVCIQDIHKVKHMKEYGPIGGNVCCCVAKARVKCYEASSHTAKAYASYCRHPTVSHVMILFLGCLSIF